MSRADGRGSPEGSNHKHLTIAPDGTLIIKNQTRATPSNIQGTLAAFQSPGGIEASPGSNICAVDPETFEIYDDINVPENAVVRTRSRGSTVKSPFTLRLGSRPIVFSGIQKRKNFHEIQTGLFRTTSNLVKRLVTLQALWVTGL